MRIASSLILSLVVILSSIELSLQSSNPVPVTPRTRISYSPSNHAPGSSNRSPPTEPPLRDRSRSPSDTHSPLFILGFTPEDLRFIRLIPNTNLLRQFEIRRYTFPRDKLIHLRGEQNTRLPMPTEKQNVLCTSDGEVFAIVYDTRRLRGIYTTRTTGIEKRAKINMYNGVVEEMTVEEIRDTPLGRSSPISKCFRFLHINKELSSQTSNPGSGVSCSRISYPPDNHASGSSNRSRPPAEPSLCNRLIPPPSSDCPSHILGYKLEEIKFVRLIPHTNPLQRFEIQRYTFPRNKPIHLKGCYNSCMPMPTEEQTVLLTSDGEVLAIVEVNTVLRGMYTMRETTQKRAKINVYNGAVKLMTTDEIRETPCGRNSVISKSFKIVRVNDSPPHLIRFPILNRSES